MYKNLSKKLVSFLVVFLLILSFSSFFNYIKAEESKNEGYTEISSIEDFLSIEENPYENYILMTDLSFKNIDYTPINFYGNFDGNNHTIYDLKTSSLNSDTNVSVDGNAKNYDTYFSGLFGQLVDASVKNLNIKACDIRIETNENCFIGGIAGYIENSSIIGCSVQGYMSLYSKNIMCGIGGIAGFGYGNIYECDTDVVLVVVDENSSSVKCEQFMGGILSTGYADVEKCSVNIKGYASIHGYAHEGGLIGMYFVHTSDKTHVGYVKDNTVNGYITFFENNSDRRAYCSEYVGEKLNRYVEIDNNSTVSFKRDERFDYSKILLPEECLNPVYEEIITDPTSTEMGYTTYNCKNCEYSYIADYTFPVKELIDFEASLSLNYLDKYTLKAEFEGDEKNWPETFFSTSDESVLTVDNEGVILAKGPGTAIVSCLTSDGNIVGECAVTVNFSITQLAISFGLILLVILIIILLIIFAIKKHKKNNL